MRNSGRERQAKVSALMDLHSVSPAFPGLLLAPGSTGCAWLLALALSQIPLPEGGNGKWLAGVQANHLSCLCWETGLGDQLFSHPGENCLAIVLW